MDVYLIQLKKIACENFELIDSLISHSIDAESTWACAAGACNRVKSDVYCKRFSFDFEHAFKVFQNSSEPFLRENK
jgi:hypothetical protein